MRNKLNTRFLQICTASILLAYLVTYSFAQDCASGNCSCASCAAEQPVQKKIVAENHDEHDHDEDEHIEHAPAVEEQHSEHNHSEESALEQEKADEHEHEESCALDHAAEVHDEHAGHDHGEHQLNTKEIITSEAMSGKISVSRIFPAEIKLNRDRSSAVSPRFASVVRQVFAEIGDEVKKGDVLASLENRETMAVYTISAPIDGVVILKNIALGETANTDAELYEIANLSTVWADISIFPKYQHSIRKGMRVEFIAHDGHTARSEIQYISPIISHETRTFTARAVLKGADEDFTPGAFVRARIITEEVDAKVRVEKEAVQKIEGESVVFVPYQEEFSTRPVQVGLSDEKYVEIKNGLQVGEAYVSSGAFSLKAEIVTSGMDPHAGHGH